MATAVAAPRLPMEEVRATLSLSIPIALTQIAMIALNTTDVLMTGRLGPDALAAGQLGHNLFFPAFITVLGILFATSAMMAQELAVRGYKGVRRTLRQGFWLVLTVTVPCWLFFWQAEALLAGPLGQDPALSAYAATYVDGAMWGFPFMCGFALLRNFIAAHSRPRPALWILVVGIFVNFLADWTLMFGHLGAPRLELFGLGLATTLVQASMFLALLVHILRDRRYRRYRLLARFWRPDWPRYRELWTVGFPIGLTKLAEAGLFAATGFLMGLIGAGELAGHAVALQCTAIAFMIPFGVAQAATVRVGYAVGRGDALGVRQASNVAIAVGVVVMLPTAVAFLTLGEPIARLYLDPSDPGGAVAIGHAVTLLAIAGIFQFADGGQAVAAGALRGMKDTKVPMVIALLGYWVVGIGGGVALAFPLGLGGPGVWAGLAVALAVVWLALLFRLDFMTRLPSAGDPAPSGRRR